MSIDRSKFKSTSVAAAKQRDQELDSSMGKEGNKNADYLKITPGEHHYRICPPHPEDGGELYAVPKAVHWLPCEVPKKDTKGNFIKDKNDKLELTIANRPLFNAKIHGGKSKDIIEEYIAFAEKVAKETYPGDESKQKEFLEPIKGGYESDYDGIMMRQSWVMYVFELTNNAKIFGRLDIGKAIKNRLNTIAATESSSDPLGTDPFTDIEDGRAISVIYNNKATKPQDYYATELYAPLVKGGGGKVTLYPLSDDDLMKLTSFPSLKKLFVNTYDRKTFDTALKGLKFFDDEHELGIFAYDEFLDIADKLSSEFPENDSSEENEKEESGDAFDKMDRDELKDYSRENKLGIIANKQMTDDMLRDLIRESLSNKNPEVVQEKVKEEVVTNEGKASDGETGDLPWDKDGNEIVKTTISEAKKSSIQERLDKLKKK